MSPPRLKTMGPRLKPIDTRTVKPPEKVAESFYHSAEWKAARSFVLKRDRYTCVRPGCGRNETRMFVDHIVERKDGGADFDPANLETLCGSHHTQKTHAEAVKRGAREY